MKRFLKGLAVAAAVIAPVMASVPANAASADAFAITGGGTITPGLTATGTPQTFNFAGTGTNVGTDGVAVTVNCAATGNDTIGSVAAGQGNTTVTCNIGAKVVVIVCVYIRVGALVIVACVNATVEVGIGICAFDPGQATPPVTSYTLACGAAYVKAP